MQSYRKRLEPIKDKVLAKTETYGQQEGMDCAGVKDYVCFRNWLKEVAGNENFGIPPKIRLIYGQTLGDQLLEAFLKKLAEVKAANTGLLNDIEYLKSQLAKEHTEEEPKVMALLAACEA